MIDCEGVTKRFTLHNQGGTVIEVLSRADVHVAPGECVALTGASGAGKSTLIRMIHGNYLVEEGRITVGGVQVSGADARTVLRLRRETLGYVSQFLRVVPRVPALDIVAEPLLTAGWEPSAARAHAAGLLTRLNVPQGLWALGPSTFSGGEQQRVNIARGFARDYPALLLDEPTASLDATNRDVVLALIREAKARGAAILGIFHDEHARAQVCDRVVDVSAFRPEAA